MRSLLIVVGIVLVGIIGLFVGTMMQPPSLTTPYYSDDPGDWITNVENYQVTDKTIVDVDKMTKGDSTIIQSRQRYVVDTGVMSFFHRGRYKGISFQEFYREPEFYTLSVGKRGEELDLLIENYTRMRIAPDMDPDDGVIEGIVVAREEDGVFVFHIFVDEDWRDQLEFTNIVWGDSIDSMQERLFDFSDETKGVYMDTITSNVNWFIQSPATGGIVVGEMTKVDMAERHVNGTFIIVQ